MFAAPMKVVVGCVLATYYNVMREEENDNNDGG